MSWNDHCKVEPSVFSLLKGPCYTETTIGMNKKKTTEGVYRKNKHIFFATVGTGWDGQTDRQTDRRRQTKMELHIYKSVGWQGRIFERRPCSSYTAKVV